MLEERQTQIRERAGLEESRLNTEFVDFLRKWSTPFLLVVALIAGIYAVRQHLRRAEEARLAEAFAQLEGSVTAGNPDALRRIAEDFDSVRAVGALARLAAADIYMEAVVRGVRPGTETIPGVEPKPEDVLTPEDRARYLDDARALYDRVLADAGNDQGKVLHAVSALFGLAAVAESQGELDAARGHYERVRTLTSGTGFDAHATVAQSRIESLDRLTNLPELPSRTTFAPLPGSVPPVAPPPEVPTLPTLSPQTGPFVKPPSAAPQSSAPESPAPAAPPGGEQPAPQPEQPATPPAPPGR